MCGIRLEFEDMRMEIEFEMSLIILFRYFPNSNWNFLNFQVYFINMG